MRCLYCGNELALLKKLTGGGEFCSEAHRQKYQEEYNRLALSRLLQAQAPVDRPPPEPLRQIEPGPVTPPPVVRRVDADPEPIESANVTGSDSAHPPEPGFLIAQFEPVLSPGELFSGEPFLAPVAAFLPNGGETRIEAGFGGTAPIGMSHLRDVFTNSAPRPLDRQPDPREFARSSPVVRIPLEPAVVRDPLTAESMFVVALDLSGSDATPWASAGYAYSFQPSFAANGAVMAQPLCEEVGRMPSTALLEFEPETDAACTSAAAPLVPVFDLASPVEFRPIVPPVPTPEPADGEPAATSSAPAPLILPETSIQPTPVVTPPSAPLLRFLSIDETDAVPVLTNGAAPNDIIVDLSALEAWEDPAGSVKLGEPQNPGHEAAVPGLAGQLIPVNLKLAVAPSASPVEQSLPPAQPDFRVAAPGLDAVAVRPKVYFASRPRPASQAAPAEVPAPAVPERAPAETVREAPPAPVSRKRDKRAASKAAKSPEPPPSAPLSQPRIASTLDLDDLRLNLEQSQLGSPLSAAWSRMGLSRRIAIGLGLVIALSIGGFLLKSSFASKPAGPPNPAAARVEPIGPGLVAGAGGWASDWTASGPKGRQISMFRPSIQLADYRIEFQGQIESKSIGWVYRAVDPKNYYASRLEMVKSGLEPTVVLVHYAMVDGRESQRKESPLPFKVKLDTVYKVRTDIFGSQFRTYLQEQLADEWSDDRLKKGGFGLMTDPGDRAQIRLVQLHELRAGK